MGDFNSRIGNTPISGIMQRFNEETINDNGDMLIAFCSQNELRIIHSTKNGDTNILSPIQETRNQSLIT